MTKLKKGKRVEGEQRAQVTADLVQRYEGGESIRSLAADCGRSYGFVQGLLKVAGVEFRKRGGDTRKPGQEAKKTAKTEKSKKAKKDKSAKKDKKKKKGKKKKDKQSAQ